MRPLYFADRRVLNNGHECCYLRYALMTQVRALDAGNIDPVAAIAVTAHSRPEDRLRALEAGFQWHVAKPVDPSELLAAIASLTGRGRQRARFPDAPRQ